MSITSALSCKILLTTLGINVRSGIAYRNPQGHGQQRVLTPFIPQCWKPGEEARQMAFAGEAKRSRTGWPKRIDISLNHSGCRRDSERSMVTLLSQSTCRLFEPKICSALMDSKFFSAQRQRSLASFISDWECVPPSVHMCLGGDVVGEKEHMMACNLLLEFP